MLPPVVSALTDSHSQSLVSASLEICQTQASSGKSLILKTFTDGRSFTPGVRPCVAEVDTG